MPGFDGPVLRAISPEATPEEVAAITAALAEVYRRRAVAAAARPARVSPWVEASRRRARRAGTSRGAWRLSGRLCRG